MKKYLVAIGISAVVAVPLRAAPRTPAPLPPSAVLFNGDFRFSVPGTTYSAAVTVPVDGAWVSGTAIWNHSGFPYWDCSHSYTGTLSPNANDYSPLFIAGWTPQGICSDQFPVFGCLNCGIDWGGRKAFPGLYMTTNNSPGFMAAGSGTVFLSSNNGGGQDDLLTLHIEQVNRNAMQNMTMFQSVDESDPTPASSTEIADRTFIANSADRVPVVPVFHYGFDSAGNDLQFPAGPGITWSAAWDNGASSVPEESFAPQGLHGHTILAIPIPKMATGSHTFTVKATLPSGATFTTPSMSVFVYAQNIYVTVEGNFDPRAPEDQSRRFVPGSTLSGTDVDLRSGPQSLQLNVIIGHGSRGTFDVRLTNGSRYPGIALNYPASSTDTSPDIDFGTGLQELAGVAIPGGRAPKVVRLPLYVHDYAGSATIEVTMPYRKTTFTTRLRLPGDNGQGLPLAGWNAGTVHVDTAGLPATEDRDDITPAGPGGDGLSAIEEMRGMFIAGTYTRLNPRRRDVFLVADGQFILNSPIVTELDRLPMNVHYLETSDIVGAAGARNLTNVSPVIDSNRASMPGARTDGQRAIRLVYQNQIYPVTTVFVPILPGVFQPQQVPTWQTGIFGATILDGIDQTQIDRTTSGNLVTRFDPRSPDGTQFVEVYERTWTNVGLSVTFSSPSYVDSAGNVVVRCGGPDPTAECDDWDIAHLMILPHVQPGGFFILNSLPNPGDYYSKPAVHCSDLTQNGLIVGGLTLAEMTRLRKSVPLHEVGHAMHMPHFHSECTDLMFDTENTFSPRRAMPDISPLATDFSALDILSIQLWE